MKRTRAVLVTGTVALLALLALAILVPPFLLPDWAYGALYGWRYPKTWTCGAATLTDAGPAVATDRVVADLGPLALASTGKHRYQLCQLPEAKLALGLVLPWRTPEHVRDLLRSTSITATLTERSGAQVGAHSGSLVGDWTWSGPYDGQAFVYGALMFDADPRIQYDLIVEVQSTGGGAYPEAKLTIQGGGWK